MTYLLDIGTRSLIDFRGKIDIAQIGIAGSVYKDFSSRYYYQQSVNFSGNIVFYIGSDRFTCLGDSL